MQTLELMRRRMKSAEDLYAVVRVMKAMAAVSIQQYEKAVGSLVDFNRTIEEGLQVALRGRPEALATSDSRLGDRWGIIVFGSDQGMCGSFNEQVATFALEHIAALSTRPRDQTFLAIGARIVGRLEDAGCAIAERFQAPTAVPGITPIVHEVLLKVEELRFEQRIEQFLLVHQRPRSGAACQPAALRLLPVNRAWLATLEKRPWPSRSAPQFTMDWRRLFSALIRQHLFVAIYRAFAESLASENTSRLASMQAAEKNIRDHLSALTTLYHQQRQQAITEELLDIVAGFESMTADESDKARLA